MKNWNYLDIPNWEMLRDQLIEFKKVTPKSDEISECWQCYVLETLKKELPDVVEAFASIGLTPRQMIFFDNHPNDLNDRNYKGKNAVFVHIDAMDDETGEDTKFEPTNAINIPLVNCENSHTLFYEVNVPEGRHPDDIYIVYEDFYGCGGLDLDIVKEIDRFTLNKPAILRINVPHGVYNPTNQIREAATFRFYEDTDHLLK